jgi:hypothetical protein
MTQLVTPDAEQLAKPYLRVALRHDGTQANQHVIVDRYGIGHALHPGETKRDVELTHDMIASLQEQRRPDRLYPSTHMKAGQAKPLHPIVVEGVGSMLESGGRFE